MKSKLYSGFGGQLFIISKIGIDILYESRHDIFIEMIHKCDMRKGFFDVTFADNFDKRPTTPFLFYSLHGRGPRGT